MGHVGLKWKHGQEDIVFGRESRRLLAASGPAEVTQAVELRLRTWLGEYWLRPLDGVPWQRHFGKGFPVELVRLDVLMGIYQDERVQQVTSMAEIQQPNSKDRTLELDWEGIMVDGAVLTGKRTVTL